MFGIRFVFVEKVHAKTTSSRTEIIDIKAYTKVRKMRSADDAQIRCEYSLEYGEAIDIIRHRLMRFYQEYHAHKISSTKLRYYVERHKILVSGSNFSFFDLKF